MLSRLLGEVRKHAGRYAEARATLEAIVERDPDDAAARNVLASVLLDLGQFDAARAHLETLVASGAADGETFANLGIAFQQAGDYEAAAVWFARAVDANATLTPALADLVHARQYLCAWDGLDALEARLAASIADPHADPRLSPFIALSLHFSPAQQLAAARRWSSASLPAVTAPAVVAARGDRLRVGYLSSDFRDHATGRLMVGLLEAHDRRRVEVFGYGYGRGADTPLRRRIVAAFEAYGPYLARWGRRFAKALSLADEVVVVPPVFSVDYAEGARFDETWTDSCRAPTVLVRSRAEAARTAMGLAGPGDVVVSFAQIGTGRETALAAMGEVTLQETS